MYTYDNSQLWSLRINVNMHPYSLTRYVYNFMGQDYGRKHVAHSNWAI